MIVFVEKMTEKKEFAQSEADVAKNELEVDISRKPFPSRKAPYFPSGDVPQWEIPRFEKHKNQRPLRKNLAQDRLEKIRANANVKRKLNDKLKKFSSQEPISRAKKCHKTNFLLEKFMPDSSLFAVEEKNVLYDKLKRYSADKRLEKVRASARKKSIEIITENSVDEAAESSCNRSVLKRASVDETIKEKLWGNDIKGERDNSGQLKQDVSKRHGITVDRQVVVPKESSRNLDAFNCKHRAANSFTKSCMNTSKTTSDLAVPRVEGKSISRNRSKLNSADKRLKKVREAVKRKTNEISPKKLPSYSPKNKSNCSVMKRNKIDTNAQRIQQEPAVQTADERLKKIETTVITTAPEIPQEALLADNSNQSVLKQIPTAVVNPEPWNVIDPISQNDSAEVMSMEVDMDWPKIDDPDLNIGKPSTQSPPPEFREWADESSSISSMNDEIQKLRQEPSYMALHENVVPDVEMNIAAPSGDILIVIDTNIFLSHLSFIQRLLKCKISTYRSPMLVIPWPVIQEVDYAMKKNNPTLSAQARSANYFIFDCLKNKHPRFFGQSLVDFRDSFKKAVSVDDYILQYCLKLVTSRNNVILLTDDKNLCSKSMVSHLPVLTKKEFESTFKISHA